MSTPLKQTDDVVGEGTTLTTGLVLDITFDDEGWQDCAEAGCEGDITSAMGDDGLHATGFTLVETEHLIWYLYR